MHHHRRPVNPRGECAAESRPFEPLEAPGHLPETYTSLPGALDQLC